MMGRRAAIKKAEALRMSMNVSSHQVQQSREERVSRNLRAARSLADLHPAPQMAQVVHSHKQELKQSAGQRARGPARSSTGR